MKYAGIKLSFLLICFVFMARGQYYNIAIGPEGGPGMGFLWGNKSSGLIGSNAKPAFGGYVGYAFQYNFSRMFALRTSIGYERRGGTLVSQPLSVGFFTVPSVTGRFKYDYITLPILARASFGKKVSFFVNIGPSFSVLLKQVTVTEVPGAPQSVANNTSAATRFDVGLCTGAGVGIPIGRLFAVSAEVRNTLGFISPNSHALFGTLKTNSSSLVFAFYYFLSPHKDKAKPKVLPLEQEY